LHLFTLIFILCDTQAFFFSLDYWLIKNFAQLHASMHHIKLCLSVLIQILYTILVHHFAFTFMFNYLQHRHYQNTQSFSLFFTIFRSAFVWFLYVYIYIHLYTYLHTHSFHLCTRHPIPSIIINISSFSFVISCVAICSLRYRPILHRNEIEYRLAAWYSYIRWYSFTCLYLSTMQTDRHLNTFLSLDTSRTLILVSFHSSLAKINFCFVAVLFEPSRQVMNNPIKS